jgi:hypothetical protein
MKEKALKLADKLDNLPKEASAYWTKDSSAMIRRLVEELDKQGEPVAWLAEHFDGRKRVEIVGFVYDQDAGWGHKRIPLYTKETLKLTEVLK